MLAVLTPIPVPSCDRVACGVGCAARYTRATSCDSASGRRSDLTKITGAIGAGGMGDVYRARVARFEREARSASALNQNEPAVRVLVNWRARLRAEP
jgi:hypothetical protein